jgi:hypothetical protein
MKPVFALLVLLAAWPALAQDQTAPNDQPAPADQMAPNDDDTDTKSAAPKDKLSPPDLWLPRQHGTLRVMNKIDSTVQTLTVPVGGNVTYQSLAIKLSGCFVRPTDLPADAAAHVTISDTRPDQPGFEGWILKNEPALHMLEHPVYDVQLAGCA